MNLAEQLEEADDEPAHSTNSKTGSDPSADNLPENQELEE
jgi:hypothetical protein